MGADFWLVVRFWAALFLVGAAAFPLTKLLFRQWYDQGYLFAKAVGMATVTYLVYLAGTLHLFPFTLTATVAALTAVFLAGVAFQAHRNVAVTSDTQKNRTIWMVVLLEEIFFFGALLFWAWIKAHEPNIRGLEKFMDFGFTKSILTHPYFPTPDMWYAGATINYYYFGHIVMALLTRLSGIDLAYTFNLMLAALFALCLSLSFSIGYQLLDQLKTLSLKTKIFGAALTAFLVTLGGNLQTIYAFTQGYTGDAVKPFWELFWNVSEFWSRLPEGLNRYWYPNATRFIPFTIHEFPSYSFVVSDIHGHVLSIPFALLAMALLIIGGSRQYQGIMQKGRLLFFGFYGFLVGILLMTNALDGPIYLGLFVILTLILNPDAKPFTSSWWKGKLEIILTTALVAGLTMLPFLVHFKAFVTGVAVNCPPAALANFRIGPILFEGVEKCQHSPLWMLLLLWGFFLYCGAWLILSKLKVQKAKPKVGGRAQSDSVGRLETVLAVFFVFSLGLIIFPEFFYFKDIYPAHFRSNTMFKLGYQAFMLFSIVSGYTIVQMLVNGRRTSGQKLRIKSYELGTHRKIFFIGLIPLLFLVSIYPIFSVRSYFDGLRTYQGLYGLTWLSREYPDDYTAIQWLNEHTTRDTPYVALVEADGDSYTDYDRFSAFTGMPTVVGWAVHEWLWRGSYDVVSPRREQVRTIYESPDLVETRMMLALYNVKYVIIGDLERQRYTRLQEWKFNRLGTAVFRSGQTVIYDVNPSSMAPQ